MGAGFLVYRDDIGPGIGKRINIAFGLRNHQVNVEQQFRVRTQGFDDSGPDRQIGYEVTVHYIDMNQVGASLSRALISSPKRLKSADNIDGAIILITYIPFIFLLS
jgi:hypothetical protein